MFDILTLCCLVHKVGKHFAPSEDASVENGACFDCCCTTPSSFPLNSHAKLSYCILFGSDSDPNGFLAWVPTRTDLLPPVLCDEPVGQAVLLGFSSRSEREYE